MADSLKARKSTDVSSQQWQWTSEMVEHLITFLKDYKTEMDYKNMDFNADVVALYSRLRQRMAVEFNVDDFGPKVLPDEVPMDGLDEESKKERIKAFKTELALAKSLTKKGYNRVKEKIRAIRKAYNKAVTNGTRSGSGKVVQEYFDKLAEIWKGSPATEQLKFGISANVSESSQPSTPSTVDEEFEDQLEDVDSSEVNGENTSLDGDDDDEERAQQHKPTAKKRLLSSTPKIVDNKRRHLEKPLSAAKRDEVLLRAAKDDIELKKNYMSQIQESQQALNEMAKSMSESLNALGKSVSDGLGLLAIALNPNMVNMLNQISSNQTINGYTNIGHYPNMHQHGIHGFYPQNQNERPPPQNQYQQEYITQASGHLDNTRQHGNASSSSMLNASQTFDKYGVHCNS